MDWKFSFNKENLIPSVNQIIGPPTPKKLTSNSGGLINKAKNMVDDRETPDALEAVSDMTNSEYINVAFDTIGNKVVVKFDSDSNFLGKSLYGLRQQILMYPSMLILKNMI